MRIAIITKGFAHGNNDWCLPPLIDFVRSISDQVEVDIYAMFYPLAQRDYHLFGARVFAFDLARRNRLMRRLSWRKVGARVAREHSSKPYDLVHAIWADTPATLGARIAANINVPLITTLYAGEAVWRPDINYGSLGSARNRAALCRVLDRSHTVTCGSQFLADIVQTNLSRSAQVIPFGLCPDRFLPIGPQAVLQGETRIVTSASFSPVKGLDLVLKAVQKLARDHPRLMTGLHWHCIGPDPANRALRGALLQQIGALPVTLHDAKPHWEMAQYYRATDLAVQGSWFESQCFAALEPAACATPVAGTAVGVLPDMASPDWTCAPGSADALAQLLSHVLSHRAGWAAETVRQQDWVLENATLDVAAPQFLALYNQVVGQ